MSVEHIGLRGTALLSECGRYRYALARTWSQLTPPMIVIGLNPSTADMDVNDPTITRCISFAKREHCGGLLMLNLFALRSTDPKELIGHPDPVGPENNDVISAAVGEPGAVIVAAWGAHRLAAARWQQLRPLGIGRLMCLRKTKRGAPWHPLYVPGASPLQLFDDGKMEDVLKESKTSP